MNRASLIIKSELIRVNNKCGTCENQTMGLLASYPASKQTGATPTLYRQKEISLLVGDSQVAQC